MDVTKSYKKIEANLEKKNIYGELKFYGTYGMINFWEIFEEESFKMN